VSDGVLLQPTLATLRGLLSGYRADATVTAARDELGGAPDPGRADHAARLRVLLNQWNCRIPYPEQGSDDMLSGSLAAWWPDARQCLPPDGQRLAVLAAAQLDAVTHAYEGLVSRPAAANRAGRVRSLGPTATAKLLYFLRPDAVPPWDKAISASTGGGSDGRAFLAHLRLCQRWAVDLEAQGRALGLEPGQLPAYLFRPGSSLARLIDEWLYATITAGLRPAAAAADPA
jgi:hypothetical protein